MATEPRIIQSARVKVQVARSLLAALSAGCKAYCILSGYDRLPDDFDTDIDFMVDGADYKRVPQLIADVARQTQTRLFQSVDHEATGRAFFLASLHNDALTIVQPDCAFDYSHFGRYWLSADEVLAARRRHPNGFWIPSAAHEFAYYLLKRLNKCDFTAEHGAKLSRLFAEDAAGCERLTRRFFAAQEADQILRFAATGDWSAMIGDTSRFSKALHASTHESFSHKLGTMMAGATHFLKRVLQPTGAWIAFMGPDGCGKSLILEAVSRELAPAFRSVPRYHMRPRVIGRKPTNQGPVTDPHGQRPRGLAVSVVKVLDLAADYCAGYLLKIRPAMMRTQLVLFDRCFLDALVDPKRIRYGGPRWLLQAAVRLAPHPELVVLLDAPPEVLYSRKREVPFEEVVRQREAYLALARRLPYAVVVDASQLPAEVAHDALDAMLEFMTRRAGMRLDLIPEQQLSSDLEAKLPS